MDLKGVAVRGKHMDKGEPKQARGAMDALRWGTREFGIMGTKPIAKPLKEVTSR